MEKPDFEKLAREKYPDDNTNHFILRQIWKQCYSDCWTEHVEPLQAENEKMKEALAWIKEIEQRNNDNYNKLELQQQNQKLREHLFKITEWFDVGCYVNDDAQIMIIEAQKTLNQPNQKEE